MRLGFHATSPMQLENIHFGGGERVPSNSTAETLSRTVGIYFPPHTLSSCLHTVNYPTVSHASITQFPPRSGDSDSFVCPVSDSALPSKSHCVSSGPHQHFSRNNQFISLQTVLSLQFVQPPVKAPSTLQGELLKGNSEVISPRFGHSVGPFPSGSNPHFSNSTKPSADPEGQACGPSAFALAVHSARNHDPGSRIFRQVPSIFTQTSPTVWQGLRITLF